MADLEALAQRVEREELSFDLWWSAFLAVRPMPKVIGCMSGNDWDSTSRRFEFLLTHHAWRDAAAMLMPPEHNWSVEVNTTGGKPGAEANVFFTGKPTRKSCWGALTASTPTHGRCSPPPFARARRTAMTDEALALRVSDARLRELIGFHNMTFSNDAAAAGSARDALWDALSQNLDGVMDALRAVLAVRELTAEALANATRNPLRTSSEFNRGKCVGMEAVAVKLRAIVGTSAGGEA